MTRAVSKWKECKGSCICQRMQGFQGANARNARDRASASTSAEGANARNARDRASARVRLKTNFCRFESVFIKRGTCTRAGPILTSIRAFVDWTNSSACIHKRWVRLHTQEPRDSTPLLVAPALHSSDAPAHTPLRLRASLWTPHTLAHTHMWRRCLTSRAITRSGHVHGLKPHDSSNAAPRQRQSPSRQSARTRTRPRAARGKAAAGAAVKMARAGSVLGCGGAGAGSAAETLDRFLPHKVPSGAPASI